MFKLSLSTKLYSPQYIIHTINAELWFWNVYKLSWHFLIFVLNMTYSYSNKPLLSFKISKLYWLLGIKKNRKTAVKYIYTSRNIYFHLFFQQIPPATSCALLTIFLLVCQKYCTPFYSSPIFWPYLLNNIPIFVLRWWAFCVIDNSHTFLPAASFLFSFPPLLLCPSSSSVLPFFPPFLLSSLSRVCCFSRTDTCEGDLELSMVRHQPEGLDQLQAQTQFTRKELQSLYRGFKNVGKHCLCAPSLILRFD